MDNNDIDVACPSDKRDEPLKEWAARYKRKCTTKSQAPKPGSLVKKESIEESIPSMEEESSMPSMSMDLGMGRRSNAMPAIPTMPSMVGMGLGRPSATHTPITVICPWEEFGDVDLKDLAAYGII